MPSRVYHYVEVLRPAVNSQDGSQAGHLANALHAKGTHRTIGIGLAPVAGHVNLFHDMLLLPEQERLLSVCAEVVPYCCSAGGSRGFVEQILDGIRNLAKDVDRMLRERRRGGAVREKRTSRIRNLLAGDNAELLMKCAEGRRNRFDRINWDHGHLKTAKETGLVSVYSAEVEMHRHLGRLHTHSSCSLIMEAVADSPLSGLRRKMMAIARPPFKCKSLSTRLRVVSKPTSDGDRKITRSTSSTRDALGNASGNAASCVSSRLSTGQSG